MLNLKCIVDPNYGSGPELRDSGPNLEAFAYHLQVDALLEVTHSSNRVQEFERVGTGEGSERASGRRLAQPRRHCVEHRLASGVRRGKQRGLQAGCLRRKNYQSERSLVPTAGPQRARPLAAALPWASSPCYGARARFSTAVSLCQGCLGTRQTNVRKRD